MKEPLTPSELEFLGLHLLDRLHSAGIAEEELAVVAQQTIEMPSLPSAQQLANALEPLLDEEARAWGKDATDASENFRGPGVVAEISSFIDQHTALLIVMAVLVRFEGPIENAINRLKEVDIKIGKLKLSTKFHEFREKASGQSRKG